jgi:hypothetical protein
MKTVSVSIVEYYAQGSVEKASLALLLWVSQLCQRKLVATEVAPTSYVSSPSEMVVGATSVATFMATAVFQQSPRQGSSKRLIYEIL